MTFEYLDHKADLGIKVCAPDYETIVSESAYALFNIVYDPESVVPLMPVLCSIKAETMDVLIVDFLNELIAMIDTNDYFFHHCDNVVITNEEGRCSLSCTIWGETQDTGKHVVKGEVKAATYSGLQLRQEDELIIFQCLLDV